MVRPRRHRPEQILDAATRLFLDEGVGVSTARIASEAGVSNGTLFNFFPTKQSLIDALYSSTKQQLADAIGDLDHDEAVVERMRAIWGRWIRWARDHRPENAVMNLLLHSGLASADAQAAGAAALAEPLRVMEEAFASDLLVDLPFAYVAALVQQHLEQAIVAELDVTQSALAFEVLWTGITR